MADRLLNAREVSALANVSKRRVYSLPIEYIDLGPRSRRWRESVVLAFLDARTAPPPSDPAQR